MNEVTQYPGRIVSTRENSLILCCTDRKLPADGRSSAQARGGEIKAVRMCEQDLQGVKIECGDPRKVEGSL